MAAPAGPSDLAATKSTLNVRETCSWVMSQAAKVQINDGAIVKTVAQLSDADLQRLSSVGSFDYDLHYVDQSSPEGQALTVQYLLTIDALNFCFWPVGCMLYAEEGLEYEHLSKGVKAAIQSDPSCISAERLAAMQGSDVQKLLGWPRPLPLQEERARLLREVGQSLLAHHGGSAARMVQSAGRSAVALARTVTALFPGFRDHAVYHGHQVFFYKRAQIFVGDVHGALGGKGLGEFTDMEQLTMFADYRVPVVLRSMGILAYSPDLEQHIASKQQLPPGSEEEVEMRAATVVAVERMRQAIEARRTQGGHVLSVTLDWWLWEAGERTRATDPPHHRTLTIYY